MDESTRNSSTALDILATYGVSEGRVFTIGTYDVGITVHSQQVRALNLAWALIETETLHTHSETTSSEIAKGPKQIQKVAVVGGGFAGLTFAAALIRKGFTGKISLFERRDALLPLQQGSDARWLHPRIYDWPAKGSELISATLPVLNWTAGRASDVVVQVMKEWQQIIEDVPKKISVYCNAHHLQIYGGMHGKPLLMEWVADKQGTVTAPRKRTADSSPVGSSDSFDYVILSVGFGLEKEQALSYWRNETLAQPNLGKGRVTYIVSGQGDGAFIDVLRLRIGMFRQDRILAELFSEDAGLIDALKLIRQKAINSQAGTTSVHFDFYNELELLDKNFSDQVIKRLKQRLRRDTQVVMHVKSKRFRDLFDVRSSHISFQNRLLAYFLYKCGGFIPSSLNIEVLQIEYDVPDQRVIRRHGTLRAESMAAILDDDLVKRLDTERNLSVGKFRQTATPVWSGGYFSFRGVLEKASSAPDDVKRGWRKEYLPSATQLLASGFCTSVAAYLQSGPTPLRDLRVTIHRSVNIGQDVVLQQCCDYLGSARDSRRLDTARRVFPAGNGTIGMANTTGLIFVSEPDADNKILNRTMKASRLPQVSRQMSNQVRSLIAIPMLTAIDQNADRFGVACVLYADSYSAEAFSTDTVKVISNMCQGFIDEISRLTQNRLDRMTNHATGELPDISSTKSQTPTPGLVPYPIKSTPRSNYPFTINFEYTDFIS